MNELTEKDSGRRNKNRLISLLNERREAKEIGITYPPLVDEKVLVAMALHYQLNAQANRDALHPAWVSGIARINELEGRRLTRLSERERLESQIKALDLQEEMDKREQEGLLMMLPVFDDPVMKQDVLNDDEKVWIERLKQIPQPDQSQ